jgi:hypothetical protein
MSISLSHSGSQIVSAILSEPEGSLRSIIFASREGLAVAQKLDDAFPQQAVNVTINHDAVAPGDFVVRSVIAGNRRKFEILATDDSGLGFRRLLAMLPDVGRKFASQTVVEFVDGQSIVELPETVVVAAYKGRK